MEVQDKTEPFHPVDMVGDYRRIIALQAEESDGPDKDTLRSNAKDLRAMWTEWQGLDSLHETAFG